MAQILEFSEIPNFWMFEKLPEELDQIIKEIFAQKGTQVVFSWVSGVVGILIDMEP